MNSAEVVVSYSQLEGVYVNGVHGLEYAVRLDSPLPIHVGDKNGPYYLSVQPNGAYESRSAVGAWETGTWVNDGSLLVFRQVGVLLRAIKVVKL